MEITQTSKTQLTANEKAIKIFKFLKAWTDENFPITTNIQEEENLTWLDSLVSDENIKLASYLASSHKLNKIDEEQNVILEIIRPELKPCPKPDALIKEYLQFNYDDVNVSELIPKKFILRQNGNYDYCECLDFVPEKKSALDKYQEIRQIWLNEAKSKLEAYKLFEKFYTLYAKLQKEGDNLELVVANGFIAWKLDHKVLNYPLLFNTVTLKFIPMVPKFQLILNESSINLYEQALTSFTDILPALEINSNLFTDLYKEIKTIDNILSIDVNIFKTFIQTLDIKGQVIDSIPQSINDNPVIYLRPVFMIRNRQSRLSDTYAKIINALNNKDSVLPQSLKKIIGVHEKNHTVNDSSKPNNGFNLNYLSIDDHLKDVLLTKPYNIEQIQIIEYLKANSAVLIQGPPGTGKTHTIANLIGHFLSQGQTVLVTAHTAKALQVIRSKVVDKLQPLCVSLLNNDIDSRNLLSESISAIIDKISLYSGKTEILLNEINILDQSRNLLIDNITETKKAIYNARISEYGELSFNGQSIKLPNAAAYLNEYEESLSYINGPIDLNNLTNTKFTQSEFQELLSLNETISNDCEVVLNEKDEITKILPNPQDFNLAVASLKTLSDNFNLDDCSYFLTVYNIAELDGKLLQVNQAKNYLNQLLKIFNDSHSDIQNQITQGLKSNLNLKPLDDFINCANANLDKYNQLESQIISHNPRFSENFNFNKNITVLEEITQYLENDHKINFLTPFLKPRWRNVINSVWIDSNKPQNLKDFRLLLDYAKVLSQKETIKNWFNRLIETYNLKIRPVDYHENSLIEFTQNIKNILGWQFSLYEPLITCLKDLGLNYESIELKNNLPANELLIQLKDQLEFFILPNINNLINQIKLEKAKLNIIQTKDNLLSHFKIGQSKYVDNLVDAIDTFEANQYQLAYHKILDVFKLNDKYLKRNELLNKLKQIAPDFSTAIENRSFNIENKDLDFLKAVNYNLLNAAFNKLAKNDINTLQTNLSNYQNELIKTTEKLVELKTWSHIVTNISGEQRQALIGWYDITRKIGKGFGKRVNQLRNEANRLLTMCKQAVPVWIMPLSRIADTFDIVNTKFDVLIIDEASQSDLNAMLSLYMSKNCIIVGDHEQISPSAVGQEIDTLNRLIDTYLDEIPNKVLYDGKTSIYDIARQAFPVALCLKEHFRCLPQIIDFSNKLCYEGKIKPLKDSSLVNIKPPLVGIKVAAQAEDLSVDNVNEAECYAITALILACLDTPAYDNKSFGVISLLGNDETNKIEKLLRHYVPAVEYEQRKILCGNSAIFQGDERDVIMLSMVDVPFGPEPLRIKDQARFKQRYNIATSRASEQLWVIHSLDANLDLKSGDLRNLLLNHVYSQASSPNTGQAKKLAQKIEKNLMAQGYKVWPKYPVGYFEIDLVVEVNNHKIALQIDGDEDFIEDKFKSDLEQQFILERLGWKFLIIQASSFNYNFNKAFDSLIEKLKDMKSFYKNSISADHKIILPEFNTINLIDDVKNKARSILVNQLNYNKKIF